MPSFTLIDKLVNHATSMEELKNGQVVDAMRAFNGSGVAANLAQDIERRLGNITNIMSNARTFYMKDAIQGHLENALGEAQAKIQESLAGILKTEAKFQQKALQAIAPPGVKVNLPTTADLEKVMVDSRVQGQTLNAWMKGIANKGRSDIMRQIRAGMSQGLDEREMLQGIIGTRAARFQDGTLEKMRRQLEAVTRTLDQQNIVAAQEAVFAANPDLVRAVQLVAVLDDRTTPYCASINGLVQPVGSGSRPPFHFGCRTWVVPVLRSWQQLGIVTPTDDQKNLFTGSPEDRMTYAEWINRQDAKVQDRVLGPTRAELLRSGRVEYDSFTNQRGRLLTLDELEARENL